LSKERFFCKGKQIAPKPISSTQTTGNLVDKYFKAYNAARIKEICQILERKIMKDDVVVGMTLSGALTPAGIGLSCVIPLIKNGLVDWIISTGANLYHDLHFALGLPLYEGTPFVNDVDLLENEIIRIYDIFTSFETLTISDYWLLTTLSRPEFQKTMGTSELHYRLGKYAAQTEKKAGLEDASLLACAYKYGVPIYTSSPGDSTIGMDIAALNLVGFNINIDTFRDVNETSSIVYYGKTKAGKSAILIWGGGSPKNFALQTEPYLQEILGFPIKGHDYFIQITDARPDTGGLSGATPHEAVSWSKVDPAMLPDAVVCYSDTSIVMPIVVSYLMEKQIKRQHKRLYNKLNILMNNSKSDFKTLKKDTKGKRGQFTTIEFLQKQISKKKNKL
jgi:deoxyhypusine synthase